MRVTNLIRRPALNQLVSGWLLIVIASRAAGLQLVSILDCTWLPHYEMRARHRRSS